MANIDQGRTWHRSKNQIQTEMDLMMVNEFESGTNPLDENAHP